MGVGVLWVCAFLDNPRESADALEAFWSDVTGGRVGPPAGDHQEFAPLQPLTGDAHLWFQRIDGEPGLHPDLLVADVEEATREAVGHGARLVSSRDDLTVLRSPGGLPFCLVRHEGQSSRPEPVGWEHGASIADQICLDIPAGSYDEESAFWTALTGWRYSRGEAEEFDDLLPGPEQPMHFLLQRLDETAGPVRAHLDFACDDRDAEAERHCGRGADLVRRAAGWTVMRDPGGRIYCVTDRPAGVDKRPREG